MLKWVKRRQVRFIALLAKAAREERDRLLGNVTEKDLGEPKPARGEHNPTAALGFEPLPKDAPQLLALREAIDDLPLAARAELYAIMRLGQGHLGADAMTDSLCDDVDLHDHLLKGLYELKAAA